MQSDRSPAPAIGKLLISALARYGPQTAVTTAAAQLSYADLDEGSSRLASGLRGLGVRPGDRVALILRNSIEYVLADLAVLKLGTVKVPLNELLSPPEVAYALSHAGASAAIVHASLGHLLAESLIRPLIVVPDTSASLDADADYSELLRSAATFEATPAASSEPAVIMYTGGTTGRPKGIVHTAGALGTNLLSHVLYGQIAFDERMLLTTPLPHSAGFFLQSGLLQGAQVRVEAGFDPQELLRIVGSDRISWTFMVPTMIYRLLDAMHDQSRDASSLRTIVYGAAPISKVRIEQALNEFGPVFLQLYGQSECPNFATTLSKGDHLRPELRGSCGQPCATVELRIGGPDGSPLSRGEVGEVMLRSPYTLARYHDAPELTDQAYRGDWLRTGDVGYQVDSGHLFLVDRTKDMIITGGMNVYCSEVEQVLFAFPGITNAAVIGVPDDDWGEAVHAFIVTSGSADFDALRAHCRARLSRYKVPKSFTLLESMPTTAYGKIDKKALRAERGRPTLAGQYPG